MINEIYKDNWMEIEKSFDVKNLIEENNKEKILNNTLNKFNLSDYLIMKNWLIYAKIIGDLSYQKVFKFDVDDKKLGPTQKELIIQRKTNLWN